MIVTDPQTFLEALKSLALKPDLPAVASAAFLVSPINFRLASESAKDNHYMDLSRLPDLARVLEQHAELARRLSEDVPVITFPGDVDAPDGVFPNNVFATSPGRLIIGRMRHPVRQREAERRDVRNYFSELMGYEIVDLSHADMVAELPGSLIIDHARGIGYCGLSERCDMAGARAMHEAFGLNLTFCFDLAAGEYHTNVVLALLAGRAAIIAVDGFADPAVAKAIAHACADRAIWIDNAQKRAFAGNAITLSENRVWMSAVAEESLRPDQRDELHAWGFRVEGVDLEEIEKAGGSLRCCIAEIF